MSPIAVTNQYFEDIIINNTLNTWFFLHFCLTQVHKGVRGVVRDKSGKPIVGAIIVLNGGVRVFTTEGGYFHALLAPGNHNIEAVADGYQQQRQEVHSQLQTMHHAG